MFLTYGFLHGGVLHFAVNMLTLLSIGPHLIARVGAARFVLIYIAALLGGGIGFGAFGTEAAPMVGASGALFGIVGAILSLEYDTRASTGDPLWPIVRAVLLLAALNAGLWWAMDGRLAWETHLGGFLAGWIAALLML